MSRARRTHSSWGECVEAGPGTPGLKLDGGAGGWSRRLEHGPWEKRDKGGAAEAEIRALSKSEALYWESYALKDDNLLWAHLYFITTDEKPLNMTSRHKAAFPSSFALSKMSFLPQFFPIYMQPSWPADWRPKCAKVQTQVREARLQHKGVDSKEKKKTQRDHQKMFILCSSLLYHMN